MGEAKRRSQLGRTATERLRQRAQDGAFGVPGAARGYLFVLDKSALGQQGLAVLKSAAGEFGGLTTLLESEAVRMWQLSSLFPFAVLHGGVAGSAPRALLATGLERLLSDTLPRAAASLDAAAGPWAWELGLEAAAEAAVRPALERLARTQAGGAGRPSPRR